MNAIVYVTPEESRELQELAFKAGYRWLDGDTTYRHADKPFLCFQNAGNSYRRIAYRTSLLNINKDIEAGYQALSMFQAVCKLKDEIKTEEEEKMIIIDGEKFSLSTIKTALRAYVKD